MLTTSRSPTITNEGPPGEVVPWEMTKDEDRSAMTQRKREPTHPGVILRRIIEETEGLSQEKLAAQLKVGYQTVTQVVNGKRSLSPDMAVRLAHRFDGMDAQSWMNMQTALDVWRAERKVEAE